MTTALEYDPVLELTDALGDQAVEPTVTIGDDTALVSYRHPHQVVTDIWVRREQSWRLLASQVTEA